jgi:hypothetical protein
MLQMSNDVRMLLPVLVAIMVAKWVADAATHSLYHGQLHVKVCITLNSVPQEMYCFARAHASLTARVQGRLSHAIRLLSFAGHPIPARGSDCQHQPGLAAGVPSHEVASCDLPGAPVLSKHTEVTNSVSRVRRLVPHCLNRSHTLTYSLDLDCRRRCRSRTCGGRFAIQPTMASLWCAARSMARCAACICMSPSKTSVGGTLSHLLHAYATMSHQLHHHAMTMCTTNRHGPCNLRLRQRQCIIRRLPYLQVFVGLVVRDHLMVLLRQALGHRVGGQLSYSDLNRRYVSSAAQRIITEQQMAVLQAGPCGRALPSLMYSNVYTQADAFKAQ